MKDAPGAMFTAFRYMDRFRCIGSECESTCCTGWQIYVDRAHYRKAQKAMSGTPELRQEFDEKFRRVKGPARSDGRFALMVLQSDGYCGFFTPDKLCGLQQRFGEEVLSHTCSQYPRSVSLSGSRYELTGVTSCPEVTRQLLLHDDALEMVEAERATFGPLLIHHELPERPAQPYLRYHDELRNLVMDVLSDRLYPLSSRLCMVAHFANRTLEFLHKDVQTLDEERLLQEVERIQNPALRGELHRRFRELPAPAAFPIRIALALAMGRAREPGYDELRRAVLAHYLGEPLVDASLTPAELEVVGARILAEYDNQKRAYAEFEPQIDGYLQNFAKNYWAREWYAGSPDLLNHTVQLLIRLAAVRFLLFGHPLLREARERGHAAKQRAVELATVNAVQRFSRAFEHDAAFTKGLRDELAAKNVVTLAHAACLAAF